MIQFICEKDVENITDSMELRSGTVIASLIADDIEAVIEVRGDVKVFYDEDGDLDHAEMYTDPETFPEGLKKIIHENNEWFDDQRVGVSFNNWFEMFVGNANNPYQGQADCVDVEGMDAKGLFEMLLDAVNEYKEHSQRRG